MVDLEASQLIKIIIGVFVVVVMIGVALFFKNQFLSFFGGVPGTDNSHSNSFQNSQTPNLNQDQDSQQPIQQENQQNSQQQATYQVNVQLIPIPINP